MENLLSSNQQSRLIRSERIIERVISLPVRGGMDCCPICGRPFKKGDVATIRQLWIDRGGYGFVGPEARVHPSCDQREMQKLH